MIRRSYMDLFKPICNNKNNLALHKYKNNITSTEDVRIFFFFLFFFKDFKKNVLERIALLDVIKP